MSDRYPLLSEQPICEAMTSCRDPGYPPVPACYSAHSCFHVLGHPGPHQSRDHEGFEWTDGSTWYREESEDGS